MSLMPDHFDEFFRAVHGYDPFPWQSRLAHNLAAGEWPDCIDLPTASGKTSLIDIAVFTLVAQATRPPAERTIGRRIFFTVNRRVIVDEAYDRALKLAKALKDAKSGTLREVADALRSIGGEVDLPLDVAQLRGGAYRDSAWARSLVQPTIVCTTADQLGSRLLFRGYGVSPGMLPIHAALCGCDSVILLDEAHVTKAFAQTLRLIEHYQQHKPGLRFVEMTATPSIVPKRRFELAAEDRAHRVLKLRQDASKPASLVKVSAKSMVGELVKRATSAVGEQRKAIGIIVNRVQTARDVYAKLREDHPAATHLVIGRMRPLDRRQLESDLRSLVGPDRKDVLDAPVFIVATQCLEVGADFDFDAMITECASIDALRQRFGRLNRRGREIVVAASIVTTDATLKDDDPVYGSSLKRTWHWLTAEGRTSIDFGVNAFANLWKDVAQADRDEMTNVTTDAAVLLPAHLDALCQTNPQPVPSPDVSYFIHGPQRDMADVTVCWRADLDPAAPQYWPDIVTLLPPTSPECMTVPLRAVRRWMLNEAPPIDADMPVRTDEQGPEKIQDARAVLRWRGTKDAVVVVDPSELRPGDRIIIPASESSSRVLGHLPGDESAAISDLAEEALAVSHRQRIIRVHSAIHSGLHALFSGYLAETESLRLAEVRERLSSLAGGVKAGPQEIGYPNGSGVVFRFKALLPVTAEDWKGETDTHDDGDDNSTDSVVPVTLARHTADVLACAQSHVDRLGLHAFESLYRTAASLHDVGKADIRFTAMLAGVSPFEVLGQPPLAKSGDRGESHRERAERRTRAMLPENFRHESLSMQLVEHYYEKLMGDCTIDRDVLLHLIASHHGHARPFMPVCDDRPEEEQLLACSVSDIAVSPALRKTWVPTHRLDSGVAERFWRLTRKHGWWGLAYIEATLRLADQQASAMEQSNGDKR